GHSVKTESTTQVRRRRVAVGLLAASVVVALLSGGRAGWAQPVEATLEFQSPPPGFLYGVGAPIALVLKLRTTTPDDVLTTEGFGDEECWRRLYFQDFLGRTVVNAAEATIHADGRLFQCLSRSGILQLVSVPVVPVEVLAGTAPGPGFYREYTVPDATKLFDLSQPGRYSVQARIPLQTFTPGSDVIDDCDQFAGQTVLNVGADTSASGFLVESNTLEFVVVNTPVGSGVAVQPPDPATGASPVSVTFNAVTQAGAT